MEDKRYSVRFTPYNHIGYMSPASFDTWEEAESYLKYLRTQVVAQDFWISDKEKSDES